MLRTKRISLPAFFLLFSLSLLQSQAISINTDASNPDPSAILDVKSTVKGLLVPRMTTAQRTAIPAPATGLLVFDTKTGSFWFYNGNDWTNLSDSSPTFIADTDGNTKVQTEESPNEDIIRFDLGGAEALVLRKNGNNQPRLELGGSNTFIGKNAGSANTSGIQNAAIGFGALLLNTTGFNNTAGGTQALYHNTTGFSNIAIGRDALYQNTDRSNLVAVGDSALYNNGMGTNNTAVGSKVLYSNTAGFNNTASGFQALYSNTFGADNTANGNFALHFNTTGSANTANGDMALQSNVSGSYSTASGCQALYSNTSGGVNTANGYQALYSNTGGQDNTAHGYRALYSNTSGSFNTATGDEALYGNTTGYANTACGFAAGSASDNLTYCTFIGCQAGQLSGYDYNNSTAIGYASHIGASNQVILGNSTVSFIGGYAAWTNLSDRRFKKNLRDDVPGLSFILQLHPVTYNLDVQALAAHLQEDRAGLADTAGGNISRKPNTLTLKSREEKSRIRYTGFVAQEVEQVAQSIGYDFSGVYKPQNEGDLYGLRYAEFTVPLVKAVQEQQEEIQSLKAENIALKAQLQKIAAALQTAGISVELKQE